MNQTEALEIVDKLVFGLQRVRSMTIEELTRLGFKENVVKAVIEDLMPFTQGSKSDALLNALTMVQNRKSITGQEFYNFMTILHTLDRALLVMVAIITETEYPYPNMKWFIELGI